MNEQLIADSVRQRFRDARVRARETSGGWLLEVIHTEVANLGASAFRREIEKTLGSIPKPRPPFLIWKLFVYGDESQRYLQQGTLHTLPQSVDREGIPITTLSENDAYMDIPEFDAEFISFNEHRGHVIPAVESLDDSGKPVLLCKPVQYLWLEAMGGNYSVAQVDPQPPSPGVRPMFQITLQ